MSLQQVASNVKFDGSFDSLTTVADRKRALADVERLSLLCVVASEVEITEDQLVDASYLNRDEIREHAQPLLDMNLIAKVPSPERKYRITKVGADELYE